ncbi:HNH endonuclease [Mycolicibacterium elephantis]|nr:HNH endonuclease [Mycolicibacterium elephantis]MCV7223643.1 HNH endonuclease [Mycolicibacterium elephantis]
MALADLTAAAVNAAIDEYDEVGRDAFLVKYGFGPAKDYFVIRDGKQYDSKAIAGAAHSYLPGGQPLHADEFSGGEATVVRQLRQLGFHVPPKRSPPWVRDEVILACDLVAQNAWQYMTAEDPRVIELSALLQRLPFHPIEVRSDTFRNPNGVARKTVDIATHHPDYTGQPTKGGAIDEEVLQEFLDDPAYMHGIAEELRRAIANDSVEQLVTPIDEEDDEAHEGRLLQRRHFVRERDKNLRRKKIADFLKKHPRVGCEVCGFDFEAIYGERGREYIEVHHTLPLHASGETKTKLSDLILLCANCHRMVHRSAPWLTPDELRGLLDQSTAATDLAVLLRRDVRASAHTQVHD